MSTNTERLLNDSKKKVLQEKIDFFRNRIQEEEKSIKYTLMYARPQHWGLNRVLLEQYNDSAPRFNYCAGQDYTAETNTIRKALK